jgi:hypothetical protein
MFEKAVQREGYTDTDIGKWGRFHTEAGATKMVYENGAYCWEVRRHPLPAPCPVRPASALPCVQHPPGAC